MDHLPVPNNACSNKRAIVPYVCLKDYDGGPFLTYPTREGVAHALPPDGNIPGGSPYWQHERTYPTPKQEKEDFLQRWLFLGLIREILGDRYPPEELKGTVETDDGTISVVRTSKLVETLDKWVADMHASRVKPHHTYEHVAECLRLAFATIYGAGPDIDWRIKVSLASLGELFTLAVNDAYNPRANKCPNSFCLFIDYEGWKNTMLSSGWCPSQVKVIFGGGVYLQTLHFLTFLSSPASGGLHARCNSDQCIAYQNDLTTYPIRHVRGCNCEHLSIDTERLTEILESGSLPLVRIRKGHTLDELSVELVPFQPPSQYIALSHVWADGLGNPYENAVPRCQLEFLHESIKKYYAKVNPQAVEEILLWYDVLCCPIKPGTGKKIALARMKKAYLEATRVLVVDASLRAYDIESMETDEACLRLLNCGWTRRLWTLQEGALPSKNSRLAFLFRDEAVNINRLMRQVQQDSKLSVARKGLAINIISQLTNFVRVSYEIDGVQHADLGSVEAGLQNRSVSVPSDEPLLIANLLDLDIADIVNGPCPVANCSSLGCDHSRIHRLWLLMPTGFRGIPSSILLRIGPRLNEPGFRWAPSTLLYKESVNDSLQPRLLSMKESSSAASSGSNYSPRKILFPLIRQSVPVLASTLSKATASFFFYMRANLEAIGWVSAIPQAPRRAPLLTDSASRGIPTSRGLLARFTGYGFSMAHCPSNIPSNPWNIIGSQIGLYCRGIDGKWYLIDRRMSVERDSFLSGKSLRALVEQEDNLWLVHMESAFNNPAYVAEAKGEQQVVTGLVVQLLSDEEGTKYVKSKLHVNIALLREPVRKLFETAYKCAKKIRGNLSAIGIAANSDWLQNEVNEANSPHYQSILKRLGGEIHRVAMQNATRDVAAATAAFSKNGLGLFKSIITMMVVGGYGCLGVVTVESQEWCFD